MHFSIFGFLWPWMVSKLWREKNQQDATIRCLLLTSISACFGHHYAHLQENKEPVTAYGVLPWFCWMWLVAFVGRCLELPARQRPTTATNHIQQNQNNTPNAVTWSLFSWRWAKWRPKHVEKNVNKKHLIVASCWFFLFALLYIFSVQLILLG